MPQRPAPTLQFLAKQWDAGRVKELCIAAHVYPPLGSRDGSREGVVGRQRFYVLYFLHAPIGAAPQWIATREARSPSVRARTWGKLDDCLATLARKGVIGNNAIQLFPYRAPEWLPILPPETRPTISARRGSREGAVAAAGGRSAA